MTDSMSLLTAQVSFLVTWPPMNLLHEAQIVLIHIPIEQYPLYMQPILRLLFGDDHDEDAAQIPWTNRHEFFNLSITPLECSIICSIHLAQKYFEPVQRTLQLMLKPRASNRDSLIIYKEPYTVIQVDGQGLDAGQRVLELTGPLAMAGISIFFITTYFCDYILVPAKARRTVTVALEQRGFVFSQEDDAFISQLSPTLQQNHLRRDSSQSEDGKLESEAHRVSPSIPSTPPAKDMDELQSRTFKKLKRHGIKPISNENLRLVGCAGSREPDLKKEERLKNDLLQVLLSMPRGANCMAASLAEMSLNQGEPNELDYSPMFLSLTITASEPISILFEERLLPRLGKSLYGAKGIDDILVPIMFDLRHLAFETTGIVGGVAGRLSQTKGRQGSYISESDLSPTAGPVDKSDPATEINFLSTARAGTVIVKANQLGRAVNALTQALDDTPT